MLEQEKVDDSLIIVGGGITGLAIAYMAANDGKKVTIIEAGKNFGGLLNTFEIGDNRLEFYYHHFFTHDIELHWLIKELNLEHLLLYRKTTMGIFKNGKIYPFNSALDILKFDPIKFVDKIKFGLTSLFLGKFANWRNYENVSCLQWFNGKAGRTTTSTLWAPLLNIKFGPYADKVPLSWMIGRLRQRLNSRKNGEEKLGYLDGSLQILLDAILKRLKESGVELISEQPIVKINFKNNSIASVSTPKRDYSGDKYIFTLPGIYLSKLLEQEQKELSSTLSKIKYFGAVCVILELYKPLSNIYWLNVADDNFPFGGIIEHTNFISEKKYNGSHIAYLSRYFAMEEEIAKMDDEEIKEMMIAKLPAIYPGFKKDWLKKVHVFRTNTAATVCDLNFSKKVPNCKTIISNMFVANMSHIYPDERSTNNSIRIAAEACRVMGIKTTLDQKTNSLSGKTGF